MRRHGFWWAGAICLLVFFLAIVTVDSALAEAKVPQPSVTGKVVDETGAPVPKQPVVIKGPEGDVVSVTNADGVFQFYNLSEGSYDVVTAGAEAESVNVSEGSWFSQFFGTSDPEPVSVNLTVNE